MLFKSKRHPADEPTSAASVDHRFVDMNAQASSSTAAEMHHPMLPPMPYPPYSYYYPPPPPQSYITPHATPNHPQHPPYPQGERIVYFPVIDPHLDPPGTSSERHGPLPDGSHPQR